MSVTFNEQMQWFLTHAVSRKRNPIKPSTILTWRVCSEKWLKPSIGNLPCEEVNNKTVKKLVEKMSASGLAPQTISNYTALVKLTIGAATDDNGEPLYPRKWNNDFLDMPVIDKHRQPIFTPETVSSIVSKNTGQAKLLLCVLASTGLRMGEALGLEVKHVSPDCRILTVEQAVWCGYVQSPKTKNAYRKVDLCTDVAVMLGEWLGERKQGFVFQTKNGSPLHQSNLLRRTLHPTLDALKVPRCGFHAFRRFRVTHLRKSRTIESLLRFWVGHSSLSISDLYDKSCMDDEYRQAEAERVGVGFEL
jgi:integrase